MRSPHLHRALCLIAFAWFGVCRAFADSPAPLEMVVLGSGGPGALGRASSSYLLLIDGVPRVLVDAGPGSFVNLGRSGLSLDRVNLVLLTHLHIDHVGELPALFKARAVSGGGPLHFDVFGPPASHGAGVYFPSVGTYLEQQFGPRGSFAYLKDFAAPLDWAAHEITSSSGAPPGTIYSNNRLVIQAIAGHHGNAPSVIYRVNYGERSVTFSGDIDPQGLPALVRIAAGSDLLVFNTVVLDPPASPAILYSLHTPPKAIGETAATAGVHALLLSHLSPSTDGQRSSVEASIHASFKGPASFAEDGMHVKP